jgi:glycogen debranching enzyme
MEHKRDTMQVMKSISDVFPILPKVPRAHEALPLPALALRAVTAKNNRTVFASSDRLYKSAVFGRDSLEVAEDLMFNKPKLAANILLTLASLQGTIESDDNEESPGKIIHEYRTTVVDGKRIDADAQDIFNHLSFRWGGNDREMAYYGSVDATPHFLRTLHMYVQVYGDSILDRSITSRRSGEKLTMRQAGQRALHWLLRHLEASETGLLEYLHRNPHGILNQVWKDSDEFYVHDDGHMANHNRPIASIEVQGMAYDALLAGAGLKLADPELCLGTARRVQQTTFKLLWQPKRHYFALGYDYDQEGNRRIIHTITANPASLMDTSIFDDISDDDRRTYITGITQRIFSKDFLTNAGIRSRSLAAANLIPFWDYHGSYVTWPKETYDISKGLRRQGFAKLAAQLENRLLNIIFKTRQYAEFFYVDEHNRILQHAPKQHTRSELFTVDSTNTPERIQAWTVSAVYAIAARRINQTLSLRLRRPAKPAGWQADFEQHLLTKIPLIERNFNPFVLRAQYQIYKYTLKNQKDT